MFERESLCRDTDPNIKQRRNFERYNMCVQYVCLHHGLSVAACCRLFSLFLSSPNQNTSTRRDAMEIVWRLIITSSQKQKAACFRWLLTAAGQDQRGAPKVTAPPILPVWSNRCHHLTLTWNAGCWECQYTNAMSSSVIPTGLGDSGGDRLGKSRPWVTFHQTHGAFDVSVSSPADSWCFCKSCPIPHDTGGPPKPEKCPARVRFWQECGPFEHPPCGPSGPPVNSCCHSVCGRVISSLCKLIPLAQFHLKKFSCAALHRVNT